jgi:hypothetical protein
MGLKSLRSQLIKQYKQGIISLSLVLVKVQISRSNEKEKLKMKFTTFVRSTYRYRFAVFWG